jgi:glycosyltransferase involved in cell wall biosynthesis
VADVTVCIPTIPSRAALLQRALTSVTAQSERVAAVAVAVDTDAAGAWTTRNRAAMMVRTEWLAFLDDDDELLPHHVGHLLEVSRAFDADVVWGWFDVVGGEDPFPPDFRGRQFDPSVPHCVPITYMARTALVQHCIVDGDGFQADPDDWGWTPQDLPLLLAMHRRSGGRFRASTETTWLWHHWGGNTTGLPAKAAAWERGRR